MNAADRHLILTVMALCATTACDDSLLDPADPNQGEAPYAELWSAFDRGYAPFAVRGVDWDEAYERHRPRAGAADAEVFAAATSLLAELDDGHVTLLARGHPLFVAQRSFRGGDHALELDLGIVYRLMTQGPIASGAARYGTLPGNIGYVHVRSWEERIPDLDELMDHMAGRNAVIVDLRHNPGGDFRNGFRLAERFAQRPRHAFTTLTKTGPGRDALGERVEWSVAPSDALGYRGPVVVLTNGLTNSAAERTLMAFRTMEHVTQIGAPTAGNHGEKVGRELSNGWRFSLVPQLVLGPDDISYEGVGLFPDIRVDNTAAEIAAGQDRQLEAALIHLEQFPSSR